MINELSMALIKTVSSSSFDKEKMGFMVTGGKWWEISRIETTGTIDDIPKLVNYFISLKKGTFWLTHIEKQTSRNGKMYCYPSGKRTIIWRKGEKYVKI